MGLGQGGGRHRGLDRGEQAFHRTAQAARDLLAGQVGGEGVEPVLQTAEVRREGLAEDVRAGGQHLAELDGDRPQALERHSQALAWTSLSRRAAGEQAERPAQKAHARGQQGLGLTWKQRVGADQHPCGAHQAHPGTQAAAAQNAHP